jgi:hypothetical protein
MKDREDFPPDTRGWAASFKDAPMSSVPLMDLDERIRRIEQRLLLVEPPEGVMSKNPALKNAWEAYKIIEKLTGASDAS